MAGTCIWQCGEALFEHGPQLWPSSKSPISGVRPVSFEPAWRMPRVVNLAQKAYKNRACDMMPELADALEEAGCQDVDILGHCRPPGPHVRGCWVVDLALGKN